MTQLTKSLPKLSLLLLLITLSLFARRSAPEKQPTDSTGESVGRTSSKMQRVTLPPPEHDTLESVFTLYWAEKEAKRLSRNVDTLESRVYITKTYGIFGATISESIEFGKVDVVPIDTDSIKFKEYIGYPSNAAQVWVFSRHNEGKVPLYSAHPDTALMLHYGFNTSNIFPLPPLGKLITSADSLHKNFTEQIADSLARVPRAFIEYYNNIDQALALYSRADTTDYLPLIGMQTIAHMTLETLKLRRPKKRMALIQALLSSDPNNHVALTRMVEATAKREFSSAQKYYNHLRSISNDDDYLLLYARAMLLEAQGDKDRARILYDEAELLTTVGTPAYTLIHRAVLRLTKAY